MLVFSLAICGISGKILQQPADGPGLPLETQFR